MLPFMNYDKLFLPDQPMEPRFVDVHSGHLNIAWRYT